MKKAFLITALLAFFSTIGQIPSSGLIGAWPFSGNANDVSGSVNHGTVVGATLVPDRCGVPNSAYSFNGTSDCILMLAAGPTGTLSRSVSFWAKTTNTVINSPRASFDYGGSTGSSDFWEIVWNYCGSGVGLDIGNQALIRGNNCIENNAWHHIAVVFDATVSTVYSSTLHYIDGVLQTSILCNVSGTTSALNTGTVPIAIARGCSANSRFWQGELDDFYLYNRALTSTEVLQLYNFTTCAVPITGNTLVCPGSTNVYSVSPISNATYTWSLPSGWSGTSSTNTISALAGTGSGIISAVASSSCGSFGASTLAVTTQTLPPLTITTTNSLLCSGNTSTLTGSGAITYTWLPGNSNNPAITFTPLVTSVYSLSGTSAGGCTASVAYTQTVVSSATLIVLAPASLCSGSTVSLTATGATTYTWLPGNLTGSLVTVSPLSTTFYTVVGNSAPTCTGSTIVQVSVPPVLAINITASSPTACLGNTISYTASATGGVPGYSYSWTGGASTAINVANQPSSGTYIYTVTSVDSNTCSATQTVAANFIMGLTLNSSTSSICPNAVATLTISGANTYTWNPGGQTGNTFTASPSSLSVYTVVGTSALGCTASATQTVSIKPAPTLSFITATITCGSLGSATLTSSGTPGPFSYTWTPTGQFGSVATGLYPGNYTITVSDLGTGCLFTPTTNFTPLIPLTGTVSATPSLICRGVNTATAGIVLSGGSGTQTYLWSDALGTQTNATGSNLAAGINTVNVVDALTFCSVAHTFVITQPSAFTLNIAATSPSICMGGSISYTANNSGGTPSYNYSWVNGTASPTFIANETSAGMYIYTVTSTDANSCTVTNTVQSKFVVNPIVSVSNTSICPFAFGTLTGSGAVSYSWSNGATGNPMSTNPLTITQYTLTGNTAGCSSTAVASIIIKPVPTATFISNAPVCQGDSLQLLGIGINLQYVWTGPASFSSAVQNPPTLYSVAISKGGNYSLKVTAQNSCTASITKSITVNLTPPAIASSGTVCEGSQLNLFANFSQGASYLWTGPPAFSSTLQNSPRANATPNMTGLYTFFITSAVGCTNAISVQASVTPNPIPVITVNNSTCVKSSITFSGSGGSTYSWFGPNAFTSTLQNPTLTNVNLSATGIYSLFAYTGSCVAGTATFITVNALPIPVAQNNGPVCENTTVNLTSTTTAQSYTWSGPGIFSSFLQNANINSVQMSQIGFYTLTVTDNNNCKASTSTFVSILPAPILTVVSTTVCMGSPLTLTASGGISYVWSGPMNYSSTFSVAFIPNVNPTNTGVYTITIVGSNSCQASATVPVVGLPFELPVPSVSISSKACINSKVNLHGAGGTSYLWTGPNEFIANSEDVSVTVTGSVVAGVYTLSVKNENNCVATKTVVLNVYSQPQGILKSNKNKECIPFCTELNFIDTGSIAPIVYKRYNINSIFKTDSVMNYCFESSGNYQANVFLRDTNNCVNTCTLVIAAYPKPHADFEYTPLNPLAGIDNVQFYNNSTGEALTGWNWFFEGNDSIYLSEKNPSYLFGNAGKYPLVLIAKNIWGCADTSIKVVMIDDELGLYIPNAFTPNGDGLNDLFLPKGQGILKYSFEIYNRWGQNIFSTHDFYSGWDGTYLGKECKTDVYIWKIVLLGSSGQTKSLNGKVSLIRGPVKSD